MDIDDLQREVNARWGNQSHNPCHRSDANHALVHMVKALGKIATAVNDSEHERRPLHAWEIEKYLADLVICATRFASDGVNLNDAVVTRLAEKFPRVETVVAGSIVDSLDVDAF